MIMGTQPREDWDEFDFLLIEAYQILEDERCGQCGLPTWICHNDMDDPETHGAIIEIALEDDTCFVKREIDAENEQNSKNDSYKAPHGTVSRPKVSHALGKPLDFRVREAYYKNLIATKTEA